MNLDLHRNVPHFLLRDPVNDWKIEQRDEHSLGLYCDSVMSAIPFPMKNIRCLGTIKQKATNLFDYQVKYLKSRSALS